MAGGNSGAIRAGKAFVELTANDEKLMKALDGAKKKVENFAKGAASVALKMGATGGALFTPIAKIFSDAVSRGADVSKLAERFNTTTESVSGLAYGFEKAGGNLEEFGGAIQGISDKINDAATANAELIDGLRGLSGRSLLGKTLDQQLDAIAERFKTITREADRSQVANGLGIGKLLPWLKRGKAGLDELRSSAKNAGAVLSAEDATRGRLALEAYTEAWQALKYALLELGTAFLPVGSESKSFAETIRSGAKSLREWLQANRGTIAAVAALGAGLIGLGASLAAVSVAASGIATIFGGVSTAVGVLGSALSIGKFGLKAFFRGLINPVTTAKALWSGLGGVFRGIIVPILAISAAGYGISKVFEWVGTSAVKGGRTFGEAFGSIYNVARKTLNGIVDAIRSGDIELAWKVAATGMKAVWYTALDELDAAVGTFIKSQRKRLFVIASLQAGLMGAKVGASAGPWGALIGFNVGALGAGAATNALVKELGKKSGDLTEKKDSAQEELNDLLKGFTAKDRIKKNLEAAGGKGYSAPTGPEVLANQKGIFSGPALQQLGYGDNAARRQLDATEQIVTNTAVLPQIAKNISPAVFR